MPWVNGEIFRIPKSRSDVILVEIKGLRNFVNPVRDVTTIMTAMMRKRCCYMPKGIFRTGVNCQMLPILHA